MALPRPAPVERYHIVVPVVHVNARRIHLSKVEMLLSGIGHLHAPRDHIGVLKRGVQQLHLHPDVLVLADQPQRLAVPLRAKSRRKPRKLRFPGNDLVRHVGEHTSCMPGYRPDADAALSVVANPSCGVLKGKTVIKRTALSVIFTRNKRRFPCPHQITGLRLL